MLAAVIGLPLLAMLQVSNGAAPAQERILVASVADLRTRVAYPPAARFRRVHFLRSVGADKREHLILCGQVDMDDPQAPSGWTVFTAAELEGFGFTQYVGDMAARLCALPGGKWDYAHDYSDRYVRAFTAR
jgi:hypothetical protein